MRLLPALVVLLLGSAAQASLPEVLGGEDALRLLEDELALDLLPDESLASASDGAISAARLDLSPRGALLDRCRMRMRRVMGIGHGASPDGRPTACRLLSFTRQWRTRYAMLRRRSRVRRQTISDRPLSYLLDPTPGPVRVSARSTFHPVVTFSPTHFWMLCTLNTMRAMPPPPPRH